MFDFLCVLYGVWICFDVFGVVYDCYLFLESGCCLLYWERPGHVEKLRPDQGIS